MNTAEPIELDGKFVIAYVEGVADVSASFEKKAVEILETNGISDPQPDEQYPAEPFAKALEQMREAVGPATTRKIGVSVVQAVDWPPSIDSVETAFETLRELFHETHINADEDDIGNYRFEKLEDGRGRAAATEAYPYPSPFAKGIFKGLLDEYTPNTAVVKVSETTPEADEKCAFELKW